MKKTTLAFVGIVTLAAALLIVYTARLVFSEHQEYGRPSLAHFILTPDSINDIADLCDSDPHFSYSSGDGPKPSIVSLDCMIDHQTVKAHLLKDEFEASSRNSYKKDGREIIIETDDRGFVTKVTILEHLE